MRQPLSIDHLEYALLEAGKDEPSAAELALYKSFSRYVSTTDASLIARFSHWVQAQLVWDSRQEPLLQGMRSAGQASYRLRYTTGYANVELAVENDGRLRRMEGEIFAANEHSELLFDTGPALITLLRHGQIVAETTSDVDGRFGFADLIADDYAMTLFLDDQARIELVTVNVL
jgi:hypothetical protein